MKFRAYLASFSRSHFGVFWGFGLLLGYLASSGAKSDDIFLLCNLIFYKCDDISRLSRLVIEIPIMGAYAHSRFTLTQ